MVLTGGLTGNLFPIKLSETSLHCKAKSPDFEPCLRIKLSSINKAKIANVFKVRYNKRCVAKAGLGILNLTPEIGRYVKS